MIASILLKYAVYGFYLGPLSASKAKLRSKEITPINCILEQSEGARY
jgi:hypothetical protein